MNSNPICHPSPANKMKCSFLDYVQLLMISWAGQWTWTPSTTPLQPKNEMHIFDYVQLLMIGQAGQWTWNPIHHSSPAKKMKCSFLDYVHFWWSAWLIDELEPHLPPLSTHKNEMLNFRLRSTSDDQPSWSIDSKSICQPSPANKMKCFFLDYVYFWWSARLVDGLEPHLPPFSSQKNEMLTFGLCLLWMISQAGLWTQTSSINPLQPIKWNTHFWITFNFWWSAGLVGGLKPHSPPLSSQKNEMLIFWLCSTSDDQLGWSMDLNPICQPSPANKMKCYFLHYVQLLMISWAGQWT